MAFENIDGLGSSIIYNDKNISIFTLERYKNTISNRSKLTRFYGNTYILNKKNIGIYEPISLDMILSFDNGMDVVNKFTKLEKVNYDKLKNEYTIVFSIQEIGKYETNIIAYNKNPITYIYVIEPRGIKNERQHPFILKDFYEKRKNNSRILSRDSAYGLNWYYLEESKSR